MSTEFTPGEWFIEKDPNDKCLWIATRGVEGDIICNPPEWDCEESLKYWPANAILIAAAKVMYQALKMIRNDAENDWQMASRKGDKDGMTNARHIKHLAEVALAAATPSGQGSSESLNGNQGSK